MDTNLAHAERDELILEGAPGVLHARRVRRAR